MARVAAIDCGTNSIRLLVADVTGRRCATSTARCGWCGSGKGVDATGVLAPEAIERTRVALADYTAIMRRKGVRAGADGRHARHARRRATATTSSRMVRATLGVEAEVISGDEEARLSFDGAVGELDPDDGPFVVVDVGGGSTEVVVGDLTDGRAGRARRPLGGHRLRAPHRALPARTTRRRPSRSRRPAR